MFSYPQGIRKVLNWMTNRYGNDYEFYIFENGWAILNEDQLDLPQQLLDN